MLFYTTLFAGMMLAVSSNSWFIIWIGLELNLMSFIPIIASSNDTYSCESALKYFLIQALASALLLSSAISTLMSSTAMALIMAAILMKMGAAPVHFWIPPVMQGISWSHCMTLMTIQKIAPMALISYFLPTDLITAMIQVVSIMSSLIGAVGGLNQTLVRKIMAYSSISHMGWMLAAVFYSPTLWAYYMSLYSLIVVSIILFLEDNQVFHFNQAFMVSRANQKVLYFSSFLSLGGLPPFLGFFPKMIVILKLSSLGFYLWLSLLLMGSLLTLFFYMRLVISAFIISSPNLKVSPMELSSATQPALMLLSLNFFLSLFPLMFSPFC